LCLQDEFPGQAPTVKVDGTELPKDLPKIGMAPLEDPKHITIEKSNVMVLGPSGVGKTMMIK
jgi:ATP-dependent Clp protease ATP-binding subunit ClpX